MPTTGTMTIDEVELLADDDHRYALIAGELIRMAPTGESHSDVTRQLVWLIESFIRPRGIEKLFVETGFVLSEASQTMLAPDIAFVR